MLSQNSSLGAGTAVAPDVVLLKRAVLAFRSGDKDVARDLLAEAAEHNPDNELVWLWTASAARTRKDALDAVERVLTLNPTNEKALQWIEKLRPAGAVAPVLSAKPSPNGVAAEQAAEEQEQVQAAAAVEEEEKAESEQGAEAAVEASQEEASTVVVEEEAVEQSEASGDDAESRLAALEAAIEDGAQDGLEESSVETDQAVEEDRLEQRETPAETAEPESEESQDPLIELLGSKAKKAPQEEDVWAALGMAGMQEAHPKAAEPTRVEAEESHEALAKQEPTAAEHIPPVQTAHEETEQDASCFICEKLAKPQDGLCSACRAIVDLSLMDLAPRHEGADRGQLTDALERVREKIETAPTAKLHIQAALISLNMRQSQQARAYLREAVRLRPHDRELVGYYDQIEKRPLILAVDDSKTVQKMISIVLEKESYRVVQAEDGLGAIAKLDEELPKLILLDITMPRMDGYQVCKVITGNEATKHIPVIMLSGKDGFFDKVRGKMVGASNYITKPFDPAELTKTIAKFLKN